jgi:hypothetical protein
LKTIDPHALSRHAAGVLFARLVLGSRAMFGGRKNWRQTLSTARQADPGPSIAGGIAVNAASAAAGE